MQFSFGRATPKANPEKIQQVKQWIYQLLQIGDDVPISLSQLQCHEPGCPPLETVITVMANPPQKYKVHKSLDEIDYTDISKISQQN